MRYLFICLAALMLFAAPAFAGPSNDFTVDVKVIVNDLFDYSINAPDVTFTPVAADVNATWMFQNNAFQGTVSTNLSWTIKADFPGFAPASWAGLGLSLRRDDPDSAPANNTGAWVAVGTTPTIISTGVPGSASPKLDLLLTGLSWTVLPATDTKTLTFTYATS